MADKVKVGWLLGVHEIEYVWVAEEFPKDKIMVFLHEGLGSVTLWRDFPRRLCQALGVRGLVFSRWGYGASTPRRYDGPWGPDFMHLQALEFLPAFFRALGLEGQTHNLWLYGHSDGGSIALIYASQPSINVEGLVVVAPHILVEPITIESIRRARRAYVLGDLRAKLARYHEDPDSTFFGWCDTWLDPAFRSWDIRPLIAKIRAPILAIQCYEDEYGTMFQVNEIGRLARNVEILRLQGCGHSPHRDQPDNVVWAVKRFYDRWAAPT